MLEAIFNLFDYIIPFLVPFAFILLLIPIINAIRGTRTVTFNISNQTYKQLKQDALMNGMSWQQQITYIVESFYLFKNKQTPPQVPEPPQQVNSPDISPPQSLAQYLSGKDQDE